MILNRRNVLLSATVGAAGAVMTNTVSAKERNLKSRSGYGRHHRKNDERY